MEVEILHALLGFSYCSANDQSAAALTVRY